MSPLSARRNWAKTLIMCPGPQRVKHFSSSYNRTLATFSAKGQIVNIWGLAAHVVSVARAPPPLCEPAAALGAVAVNGLGWAPIKLYLQEQVEGWTWPQDCHCGVLPHHMDFLKTVRFSKQEEGKVQSEPL